MSRYDKVLTWIAVGLLLLVIHSMAFGQSVIIHGRSYHSVGVHNNNNIGIGYRTDSNYLVGTYYNSDHKVTVYGGYMFSYGDYLRLPVVVATGYKWPLTPIAIPTLSLPVQSGLRFNIGVGPIRSDDKIGVLVHTSLEYNFK